MPEFRVLWRQCPTVQHPTKVLFVQADDAKDAEAIAVDHVERHFGISWFKVMEIGEAKPVPKGRVL